MSEIEIIEAMTDVAALDAKLTAALDEEASGIAGEWAKTQGSKYEKFAESNPFEAGIESVVRNPEKGGFDIKVKGQDEPFNTRDVNADFQGRLSIDAPREPDIMEGFKKMGMDAKDFKTDDWKNVNKTQQNSFRESPQTKEFNELRESKKASKGRTEPKDADDFKKQTKKQLDDLEKKLDKMNKEKGSSAGRWVKSGLKWLAGGFTALQLYNAIKSHQDSMNGCWLVAQDSNAQSSQSSQRCKVDILTCNSDCLTNTENSFKICGYCTQFQTIKGVIPSDACMAGSIPEWNPAAPGCAICPKTPKWGCDKAGNCVLDPKGTFSDNTCKGKCTKGTQCASQVDAQKAGGLPGTYQCKGQLKDCPSHICSSGCSCTSTNQACPPTGGTSGGQNCSTMCNAVNYQLPPNFVMQCVNADFWTAADDYFQGGIGELTKILEKIIKIVIIIIIILILLALIVGGVKLLFNKMNKK